jgi:hypothetical protein
VSGALLGDVSSFQTGSATVTPSGSFTLSGDTFTNSSVGPGSSPSFGAYISGTSAVVGDSTFTGFAQGLAVVVQGTADVTGSTATAPATLSPGGGIYVYANAVDVSSDQVSGYAYMTGPGWWPDSQATGIFVQSLGSAVVDSNTLTDDAIGIATISSIYGPFPAPSWPIAAAPSAGPIDVSNNLVTNSGAFGIAFELNQNANTLVSSPTVTVEGNVVDNAVSGAVGLMVDQGTYTITGNTFEGTRTSGSSGASQPTGEGTIDTASVQVLDAYDSATAAFAGANTFVDTTLYYAVLNLTTGPPFFAAVIGEPALTLPATPTVSTTAVDVDQSMTVSGSIPTSGVPSYSWTWLVAVNAGGFSPASVCETNAGTGATSGASVSCSISGGMLIPGDTYAFELEVTDSATSPVTQTSPASASVFVGSTLTPPGTPSVTATALDVDQSLGVSDTIPTTGWSAYSWQWMESVNGGASLPSSVCALNGGSGASPGTLETCSVSGGTLTVGDTYAFELMVTDGANPAESQTSADSATVSVASALTAPSEPTVSATALDENQVLTVTDQLPITGTPTYTWQWYVSVNGAPIIAATQCSLNHGGGGPGATITCTIAHNTLTVGDSYAFELTVTDSASVGEMLSSPMSSTVSVSSALIAPTRPTPSEPAIDVNQPETVKSKTTLTGTAPYSYSWLISVNGAPYGPATQCTHNTGTALGGVTVTCVIPANTLVALDYYGFELSLTDSASSPEAKTSLAPLATVTVGTVLTHPGAPTVSSTKLDVNQTLTATGTIPTTGTALYSWTWLISVNGGTYSTATACATDHGTSAPGGTTVMCTIAANTLTVADHYKLALRVTDSATVPESENSVGSATVTVYSALTAPATPTVSSTHIAVNQVLTINAKLPTSGAPPYSWKWMVSVNGGAYSEATVCTTYSGTGGGGATVVCTVAANTLTVGDSYNFELEVADSATQEETATSVASPTVSVGP